MEFRWLVRVQCNANGTRPHRERLDVWVMNSEVALSRQPS
jgi:hypothetical protein